MTLLSTACATQVPISIPRPTMSDRRDQLSRQFFNFTLQPTSPLHSLLPPPRDQLLITRPRAASKFPRIPTRTKKVSVLSLVYPSPLSDLTICSPNHYHCILNHCFILLCFLNFIIVSCFHLSSASWLLFSNKSSVQSIGSMSVSGTVSEIFSVKEWRETGGRVVQGHWTWRRSIDYNTVYDCLLTGHCKYSSMLKKRKGKGKCIYIALIFVVHARRSGMNYIVLLQLHQCLPLPRKRSPDGASPDWGCGHLIAA